MVRIFERYLNELGRERVLTPDEEARLARASRAGDERARARLVSANLRFVVSVARGYRGRGLPLADLVEEGNLGLVQAADRFDPSRGVRFISYAQFWIRRSIRQALAAQLERPTRDERPWKRVSFDEPVPGTSVSLAEVLADRRNPAPGERLAREGLRGTLEASLADLPEREAGVLRSYFGLGRERPLDLGEIASELGVSRERARQLKERALSRLRAGSGRHGLSGFAGEVDSG
ncbi:MAG: sigma-70 family RNA polymerase sigma factor, partial [Gemmatimonadota bacterium]|nr:sigma-70 family RNA polymerase sigma factor [Gemmatimonadota bacterium]